MAAQETISSPTRIADRLRPTAGQVTSAIEAKKASLIEKAVALAAEMLEAADRTVAEDFISEIL